MLAGLMSRWTRPWAWAAARPVGHLHADPQDLLEFQGPCTVDPLLERLAWAVGHNQVWQHRGSDDRMDGHNVIVNYGGGSAGLAGESLPGRGAGR